MTDLPPRSRRRSISRAIREAMASGQHQVEFHPDGRVRVLPLHADPAKADEAALDAEIGEFLDRGDGRS